MLWLGFVKKPSGVPGLQAGSLKEVRSCGGRSLGCTLSSAPPPAPSRLLGPSVSLATVVQRLPERASVNPGIPPLAPHCPVVFAWAHRLTDNKNGGAEPDGA